MPEAMGGPEYGSIVAPYIGAVFEGSRILRKVVDIRTGIPEVPVYKVEDSDNRQLWAFRNIHAYSEYTSPITVHWYPASQDWVLDIRTASSAGKIDPADPDKKKRIPLDSVERKGAVESEKLMKAMIAVTASARAMETSAGAMDKYVEALVGGDADRADTWSEFLIHGGEDKIELLLANPAINHYFCKLEEDAYITTRDATGKLTDKPNLNSQLVSYLQKDGYKGGFREYIYEFLLKETDPEIKVLSRAFDYEPIEDSEVRTAAAKLAADIFLIDKYTEWEKGVEDQYHELHKGEPEPKKQRIQLKPTENWGGNPLRAVIEPSFLPKTIKHMYREDEQILVLVDKAFTFDFEIPSNLPREKKEELEQLKENFRRNNFLKPTMTSPLKALNRYGQALMTLFGGSTAPGLPVLNDRVFSGKESITNIWELMNQVVGDTSGKKKKHENEELWPFGKDIMGWFTTRILYIKSVAAVRQFMSPGTLTFTFSTDDQRNLRKVAEIIFGTSLRGEAGILRETASDRLGFKYRTNRIPGEAELIEQTKNVLLLGGEHGKEAAYLRRFFQATFGVAAAVSGGGGRRK